ncbi:Trafficking protein particle complex subunit 12 [Thoreauomyces humboldtii]|nr:Trafficking protein particle complex subunit 12 [Thoreauomyces humboldtii]
MASTTDAFGDAAAPTTNEAEEGHSSQLHQQESELLVNEHHQLAPSELLLLDDSNASQLDAQAFPASSVASDSNESLPENVALGNDVQPDLSLLAATDPMATLATVSSSPPLNPATSTIPRAASMEFDDVSAAGVTENPLGFGNFSHTGSLIDIQPLGGAEQPHRTELPRTPAAVADGPIPFFAPPSGNDAGVDFFAGLASQKYVAEPSTHTAPSPVSATSATAISPSAGSIISLETATMSGQRRPSAASFTTSKSARVTPPPPPKPQRFGSISTMNANAALYASNAPGLDPRFHDLPTRRWIDPLVFYDVPPRDPVGEIFPKAFPASANVTRPQRRILRLEDVQNDPDPLLALIVAQSWRSVANHARTLLVSTHPADVHAVMRLWLVRLLALSKLKLYEFAGAELNKAAPDLDHPQLAYEAHPDVFPGLEGSMVSFEIRLFAARLSAFRGKPMQAIERLYALLHRTTKDKTVEPARRTQRWSQLQLHIATILLVDLKDHRGATAILRSLANHNPTDPHLAAALARTYLQLGNLPQARAVLSSHDNHPSTHLAHLAFLNIADGQFESALPSLTTLLAAHTLNDATATTNVNNLALAHLYTGNVTQAVSFLDSVVVDHPARATACEDLLFNLCSLYDLCDCSVERKRRLVAGVVAVHAGDGFDTACLKF